MMRRWFLALLTVMIALAMFVAPPASAAGTPIGRLGETLRIEYGLIVADVTVTNVLPSDIPPGFGYPPRWGREAVYRAQVTINVIKAPNPSILASKFTFQGQTQTGDPYMPRNTDAPDALQYAILNAPQGSTVTGGVWWDVYRDLISAIVVVEPKSGQHLAQWNI
jgi:hypothetical protein